MGAFVVCVRPSLGATRQLGHRAPARGRRREAHVIWYQLWEDLRLGLLDCGWWERLLLTVSASGLKPAACNVCGFGRRNSNTIISIEELSDRHWEIKVLTLFSMSTASK